MFSNKNRSDKYNSNNYDKKLKQHIIFCEINKDRLNQMINYIFIDFCKLSVYGYDSHIDEYWGKKMFANRSLLHFNFSINYHNDKSSVILISPISGDIIDINELVAKVKESFEFYSSPKFIKSLF
jgi:hypothetical protein